MEENDDQMFLIKLVVGFIIAKIVSVLVDRQYEAYDEYLVIRACNVVESFLVNKILRSSPASMKEKSGQGKVLNHIEIDSEKIGEMLCHVAYIIVYPFETAIYIGLLFKYFGIAFLFGMIPLILNCFVNYVLFVRYAAKEEEYLFKKDCRMEVTMETFESLKLLKMYVWEKLFQKKVKGVFL